MYLYAVQMKIPKYPFCPIKIGFSVEPSRRVREFTQGPFPTVWLGQWDAPNGYADESAVHAAFHRYRLFGEWFYPAPEVITFLEEKLGDQMTLDAEAKSSRVRKFERRFAEMFQQGQPASLPDPFDLPAYFPLPYEAALKEYMKVITERWPYYGAPDFRPNLQCATEEDLVEILDISLDEVRTKVPCIRLDKSTVRYDLECVRRFLMKHPTYLRRHQQTVLQVK